MSEATTRLKLKCSIEFGTRRSELMVAMWRTSRLPASSLILPPQLSMSKISGVPVASLHHDRVDGNHPFMSGRHFIHKDACTNEFRQPSDQSSSCNLSVPAACLCLAVHDSLRSRLQLALLTGMRRSNETMRLAVLSQCQAPSRHAGNPGNCS